MKTTIKIWLAGLILLVGCHKDEKTVEPDGLRINQVVRLDANRSFSITRINDGRCPSGGDVVCIWQGVAQVTVRLNQNSKTDTVSVASFDAFDGLFKRKRIATLDGSTWTVELIDVWPYPSDWQDQLRTDRKIVQLKVSAQ